MSTISETISVLEEYNKWRRGDETISQPDPFEVGVAIGDAVRLLRELAAEREKVRVLEEAAKPFIEYAKAYGACTGSELWASNGTKLRPRDWLTLAATKEKK